MSRIVFITIDEEQYPILFSVSAMAEIFERYGDLSSMIETVTSESSPAKQGHEISWIIGTLNAAAVAYLNYKGQDAKKISADMVCVLLNPYEQINCYQTILECINAGSAQTVEIELEPKNGKATQGK